MAQIDAIEVAELRRLVDHLFRGLETAGIDRVAVTRRHHWTVFPDEAFDVERSPSPVLGDVVDDLGDLRREIENLDAGEFVSIWHAFHHLSGLLKFIAFADMSGSLEPRARGGV